MRRGGGSPGQRGFALLIVLWTLALLALLLTSLMASGSSTLRVAGNVRAGAIATAAADGGVQRAIFELRLGAWPAGGPPHRVTIGHAAVTIAIDDENGRINPNNSPPALLAALLGAVGADPADAQVLSRAMVDWRTASPLALSGGLKLDRYRQANLPYGPPNRPFDSVDEIGQVAGMNAGLLVRLQPYLSVYQTGDARETAGSSFDRSVLQDAAAIGGTSALIGRISPDDIVLIRANAMLADGTRFERRAVVRLAGQRNTGQASWQILTWN